jgi:putative inorganic carbon (HCO3(-)) transporter
MGSGAAPAVRNTRLWAMPAPTGARLPFYALMFFTFTVLVAPQGLLPALAPLHLALVAATVAAATHVADRLRRAAPLTVSEPEIRLALVLFGLGTLSVPTSYWIEGSVQTLLGLFGKSLIVFLLIANILVTAERLRGMLWLLTLGSMIPAATVVKDYLSGDLVDARVQGYLSALTSNPNDVALTLNIVIALAVGLALASRKRGHRVALAAAIALGVAGVVVTFSRAGFIFLTTTLLLYLGRLKKGRSGIVLLLLLLLVLTLNVDGFIARLGTIGDVKTDGSGRERWETIGKAFSLMATHPLTGVGVGQSILALNDIGGVRWRNIHNVYLEIAVDLGIPALLVYLALLYRALRSVAEVRRAWSAADVDLHYLAQGLEISLIGFAVAAMFYPVAYHLFFYYLLGLAVAVKGLGRQEILAHVGTEPAAASPSSRDRRSIADQ